MSSMRNLSSQECVELLNRMDHVQTMLVDIQHNSSEEGQALFSLFNSIDTELCEAWDIINNQRVFQKHHKGN